ncbi:Tau class glutathione transferase GSTU45 [Cinnamomum micranthum f. kanehirae]|uniref:glutathione transferase n=1 Tax=Cinnamomum micranthum f. kanehirae TaxID=337451 RepID=A0A443NB80_9MAGN|nr:Tau class glutathione transferase GSTU45 [Cinnamomum micranthum f. kanehirae]
MSEEVKVFGAWGSPMSHRVELALRLKGIEYENIEEDLSNKSPLLLKYNPVHKKIPVLVHKGKPIAESMVILEYIDETWKHNPLLPQDPYERAMARFWAKFFEEKCLMQVWMTCCSKGSEQEKHMQEAMENLKTLETALQGKKFFGGEAIGLVDIACIVLAYWLELNLQVVGIVLIEEEKLPMLHQWAQELLNTSVVKESLPPRDKLLAIFKARKEASTNAA